MAQARSTRDEAFGFDSDFIHSMAQDKAYKAQSSEVSVTGARSGGTSGGTCGGTSGGGEWWSEGRDGRDKSAVRLVLGVV